VIKNGSNPFDVFAQVDPKVDEALKKEFMDELQVMA